MDGTTSFHIAHSPLTLMSAKELPVGSNEAPQTSSVSVIFAIANFFLTSHTMTLLSALAVTKYFPFGDQRMREIASVCPFSSHSICLNVPRSKNVTSFSRPGTARICPSGRHATAFKSGDSPVANGASVACSFTSPASSSSLVGFNSHTTTMPFSSVAAK